MCPLSKLACVFGDTAMCVLLSSSIIKKKKKKYQPVRDIGRGRCQQQPGEGHLHPGCDHTVLTCVSR